MANVIGPNVQRRKTLKAAIAKVDDDDRMSLEDLARAWGVSKPRFVNKQREMEGEGFAWPAHEKDGNRHLYPAKQALVLMLEYETRADDRARRKKDRVGAILGQGGDVDDHHDALPISELALLNREAARAEERKREQGLYCSLADQAATAGIVFSLFSETLTNLSAQVDPNGALAPAVRTALDEKGRDLLRTLHNRMREVLDTDARPRQTRGPGTRKPTRRTGRAGA